MLGAQRFSFRLGWIPYFISEMSQNETILQDEFIKGPGKFKK